jgi:hypothetical protein
MQESELESEFEQGLHETESEAGLEGEGILGSIGSALGGLLGEGEGEDELEAELEGESEYEDELEGEGILGSIGSALGGLLGEGESELELEHGEQFFGGIGKFLRRAAPVLRSVAKVALPVVASAFGPAGTVVGGLASKLLEGEGEMEGELEDELGAHEMEGEGESEAEMEISNHEYTSHEALAEMMAAEAAHEVHEGEAEAASGAAVITTLSPRDRRALRRMLPNLVRAAALITRLLRRRRQTRAVVRVMPTVIRRTVKSLKRQAAQGKPITKPLAARTMARQIRQVIGRPRICAAALRRNIQVSRRMRRPQRFRRVAG